MTRRLAQLAETWRARAEEAGAAGRLAPALLWRRAADEVEAALDAPPAAVSARELELAFYRPDRRGVPAREVGG